jgi:hypothetical protein
MEKKSRNIRVRRGTNLQRKQVVFEEGELVYTNDINRLYVGDNHTKGGNLISHLNKILTSLDYKYDKNLNGDIIYDSIKNSVCILYNNNLLELTTNNKVFQDLTDELTFINDLIDKIKKGCCDDVLLTDNNQKLLTDSDDFLVK